MLCVTTWAVTAAPGPIHAQAALAPRAAGDLAAALEHDWRWSRFTTTSGLPSDSVDDLVEAADGTVWAATRRGLAWFDGYRWNAVGAADGLPEPGAKSLVAIGADEILAIVGGRLYRGGRNGFRAVEITVDGASYRAVAIGRGTPQEAFILTTGGQEPRLETLVYDGGSFRWVTPRLQSFADPEEGLLWGNGAGAFWLPTDRGLQRWENGVWEEYISSALDGGVAVTSIVETADGAGIASIENPPRARGIWEWSRGEAPRRNPTETADLFASVDISRDGDAVVVYRSGHAHVRQGGQWSRVDRVPGQLGGVQFIKFRENGDLWLATQNGLYLFRRSLQRWTEYEAVSLDLRNEILEILPTRDGSFWLATGDGISIRRVNGEIDRVDSINGTDLREVTGLAEDRHGGVWVSSGSALQGVYRWNGNIWQHFGAEDGLPALRVHKIRPDRSGRLWFLGMAPMTGLAVSRPEPGAYVLADDGSGPWTGEARFEAWTPEQGLLDGRVYDFAEAADGARWFATSGGLSRWREGTWTHWTTANGLQRNRIFTLVVDENDKLWFGDQGSGLGYIDGEDRPGYLTTADGLISDIVQEVRLAPGGGLWISTRGGLSRLRGDEFLRFGMASGLSTPILWPILPLEDRVIVGTSGRGVSVLSLAETSIPPPRVLLGPSVVGEHSALLRWTADAYWGQLPPESILTRFRLDGGEWTAWSTARERFLAGIPPGEHAFEVQARGLFGDPDASTVAGSFATVLPFYVRPGFYIPVGALLLLVAMLAESRRRHASALWQRDKEHRRRLEDRVAERTDALRESEERLRLLIETVHVIPWVAAGETWDFTYVGPQAVDVLGYPVEQWYEPSFWQDHMHPDDAEAALAYCNRQVTVTDRYEFEYRMLAADGSVVWLHDLVAVDRQDGQPTMLRGFMIDITSRKRAEAERIEAESEALEHRERLAHLSRVNMLGEMATGIAHEVNQPLTAVSTYTQACRRMIEAGLIDEDQIIDVLSRISEEAVRAGDMIHGLKALVRKRSSELRVCNVNDLVREVIPLAEVEARPLGIELRLRLAEDLPDILADEVQIQQVVLNLIRNAIEATTAATGSVQVDTARVEGDMIEVAVGDHGTGVTDTDPEQVFQPFFSTKQEGMGMGLSISRSIIEAHGGQIAYRSREGRGSTFFFRLPAEQQLTASAR